MRRCLLHAVTLFAACGIARAQHAQQEQSIDAREFADWDKYLPAITAWVERDYPNQGELTPRVVDTTSFNGTPTALVEVPCCGPRDGIYIVQIERGLPVQAKVTGPHGERVGDFLRGASTMHGADTQFNAKWNAVLATSFDDILDDNGTIGECRQYTYVWSAIWKRFEWSRSLSYHRHAPNCGSLGIK